MKFDYCGRTYDFDDSKILLSEFRYLKKVIGLTSGDVITGLLRMDAEALAAAVLLSAKRAGEPLKPEDLDDLDVIALINSIVEHRNADAQAEQEGHGAASTNDVAIGPSLAVGELAPDEVAAAEEAVAKLRAERDVADADARGRSAAGATAEPVKAPARAPRKRAAKPAA